jgi:hypothetical protein
MNVEILERGCAVSFLGIFVPYFWYSVGISKYSFNRRPADWKLDKWIVAVTISIIGNFNH